MRKAQSAGDRSKVHKNDTYVILKLSDISEALTFDLWDEPASGGECFHSVEKRIGADHLP